ncbi:MAG: Obg family GTPase CgtA [Patescibacteria group bacterium]
MAFTDEITISLKAGKGGDGVVRWRHEKYKEKAGPSGGNGGRGGSVKAVAVRDIFRLSHYAQFPELSAQDGEEGMKESRTGGGGEDLVLELPVGSVITNTKSGERFELLKEGKEVLLLRGGKGGFGNEYFKSSRNVTPKEQTDGKPGESADFHVELRLIADIGLVGFPNAGKSTLLNSLTGAKSKVGSYKFTTLEPYLGDLHGVIIADIPGLIEGASQGRGLGHAFLRHISRTRLLVFCISADSEDAVKEYEAVKGELESYDVSMLEKPAVLVITKSDVVDENYLEKIKKETSAKTGLSVYSVSILDDESVKHLSGKLTDWAEKKDEQLS